MLYIPNTALLCCLGLALTVAYGIVRLYIPKHHRNEPPLVPSTIPLVGHILGLLRHGSLYYQLTR